MQKKNDYNHNIFLQIKLIKKTNWYVITFYIFLQFRKSFSLTIMTEVKDTFFISTFSGLTKLELRILLRSQH